MTDQPPDAARVASPLGLMAKGVPGTLRRSFEFTGRSTRTDVIAYAVMALLLVPFGLWLIATVLDMPLPRPVELAITTLVAVPFFALFVRRCHDCGLGTWPLMLTIPGFALPLLRAGAATAGGIGASQMLDRVIWPIDWLAIATNLAVIVLCLWPGTAGPNAYGADPRGAD